MEEDLDDDGIACEATKADKVPPHPERSSVAFTVSGTCRSRIADDDLLSGGGGLSDRNPSKSRPASSVFPVSFPC
jgi:hypothetical protein